MNSYLPVLVFALLASRGGKISEETLAPLMKMLGAGDLAALKGSPVAELLGGKLSPEKILPVAIRMMASYKDEKAQKKDPPCGGPAYLEPIADIAGEEISCALTNYFSAEHR